MTDTRRLLSMVREWPWGLALLSDPGSTFELPEELGPHGVVAVRSAIAVGILHGIDGSASAEVWEGRVVEALACIYEGEFTADSGEIELADAAGEESVRAAINAGTRHLRVLVDDRQSPERVVFELGGR